MGTNRKHTSVAGSGTAAFVTAPEPLPVGWPIGNTNPNLETVSIPQGRSFVGTDLAPQKT
jgi:hypothetical protein